MFSPIASFARKVFGPRAEPLAQPVAPVTAAPRPLSQAVISARLDAAEGKSELAAVLREGRPGPILQAGWAYVVEDIEVSRRYADASLRRLGWRVFSFPDAGSCVQAMAKFKPEILLLDIGLPDGSGLIMASRLRRQMGPNKMRVVGYTALDPEEHGALFDAGFDAVIAKPGFFDEFERAVGRAPGAQAVRA